MEQMVEDTPVHNLTVVDHEEVGTEVKMVPMVVVQVQVHTVDPMVVVQVVVEDTEEMVQTVVVEEAQMAMVEVVKMELKDLRQIAEGHPKCHNNNNSNLLTTQMNLANNNSNHHRQAMVLAHIKKCLICKLKEKMKKRSNFSFVLVPRII